MPRDKRAPVNVMLPLTQDAWSTCIDIAGASVESVDGVCKYALVLVDDHTRFKAVHLLKH
eukprot:6212317-Pleurochrysis_carterae.AAC.3